MICWLMRFLQFLNHLPTWLSGFLKQHYVSLFGEATCHFVFVFNWDLENFLSSKICCEILNLTAGPRLLFVTKYRLRRDRTRNSSVKRKKEKQTNNRLVLPFGRALWGYVRYGVLSITSELAGKRLSDDRIHLLLASALRFRATGTPSIKRTSPEEENLVKAGCQL